MKKILLVALMLLCLCSCDNSNPPTPQASLQPNQENQQSESLKTIAISENDGRFDSFNIYEDCVHDLTQSGDSEETIILATSAKKDEDGYFLWDDSQQWSLYVKNNNGMYVLYEDSVHGNLNMNVSEHYLDDGGVESVIRLTVSGSAGFEIREYKFSNGVFTEEIAYNTGAINELSVNKYY